MQEKLSYIFSNSKLLKKIDFVTHKYQLTEEEDVRLKSLLLIYYLITEKEDLDEEFDFIMTGILNHRGPDSYHKIIEEMIERLFVKNEFDFVLAQKIIDHYFIDGYCFHSFNASFTDSIQTHGLSTQHRLWDDAELQRIKDIFLEHENKHIFGLYQPNKKTPLFFANSLKSASFYAATSPSWFHHFVKGGFAMNAVYDEKAFYRKDFEKALKNVQISCQLSNLSVSETEQVIEFFQNHWQILAKEQFPMLALVKRDVIKENIEIIPPNSNESARDYIKRIFRIYGDRNYTTWDTIEPEKIFLFSYDFKKGEHR